MIADHSDYIGKRVGIPATAGGGSSARATRKPKPGAGSRFALLNAFTDFTLRQLRRNEIAVWLILYRDSRDGIARTGQADIGRRAGVDPRTVRRALRTLERLGLLIVVRRGRLGKGPSAYRVRGLIPDDALRTQLCPHVTGQNDATYEDTALSAIPEGTIRQPAQERGCPDTQLSGASEHE